MMEEHMKDDVKLMLRLTFLVLIPILCVSAFVSHLTAKYIESIVIGIVILILYSVVMSCLSVLWTIWLIDKDIL